MSAALSEEVESFDLPLAHQDVKETKIGTYTSNIHWIFAVLYSLVNGLCVGKNYHTGCQRRRTVVERQKAQVPSSLGFPCKHKAHRDGQTTEGVPRRAL